MSRYRYEVRWRGKRYRTVDYNEAVEEVSAAQKYDEWRSLFPNLRIVAILLP